MSIIVSIAMPVLTREITVITASITTAPEKKITFCFALRRLKIRRYIARPIKYPAILVIKSSVAKLPNMVASCST